jgi:hypothetical protein
MHASAKEVIAATEFVFARHGEVRENRDFPLTRGDFVIGFAAVCGAGALCRDLLLARTFKVDWVFL